VGTRGSLSVLVNEAVPPRHLLVLVNKLAYSVYLGLHSRHVPAPELQSGAVAPSHARVCARGVELSNEPVNCVVVRVKQSQPFLLLIKFIRFIRRKWSS
jgi:hypothetical protein